MAGVEVLKHVVVVLEARNVLLPSSEKESQSQA